MGTFLRKTAKQQNPFKDKRYQNDKDNPLELLR